MLFCSLFSTWAFLLKNSFPWDFPGSPVVETPCFQYRGTGLIPCWRTVRSHMSQPWEVCVQLFVTLWTIVHQASLSMEFFKQKHWSGLPFPSPGDLPKPEIEPTSLTSPAWAGRLY